MKKVLIMLSLIVFAVLGRLFLRDLPNIETITAASLLGGALLGRKWFFVVPLIAMGVTDLIIGNTPIFMFTWTGFAVIGLAGLVLYKADKKSLWFVPQMAGMGLGAALFFYLFTNFGVWLIGWLYPLTLAGLAQSYVMGLPFLRLNLFSALTVVPAAAFTTVMLYRYGSVLLRLPARFCRILAKR